MHPDYNALIGLALIAAAILINLAHVLRARRTFRERIRRDIILGVQP